jgi:hypothetical protein
VDAPVDNPQQDRVDPVTAVDVSPAPTAAGPSAPPARLDAEYERVPVGTQVERPWSAPYKTRWISAGSPYELHTPEARSALRRVLADVIETEGPIHEDLLVQRAREAWGLARAGGRARTAVVQVAQALVRSKTVSSEGSFFDVAHRTTLEARTPGAGEVVRKVLHVAPAERRLALWELAAECPGMSAEELMKQTCDFFGWRRLGPDIRATLSSDIEALHHGDRMTGGPDRITVVR